MDEESERLAEQERLSKLSPEEFVEYELEKHKEKLRNRIGFQCACCYAPKKSSEAAGAHHYKTENRDLQKAMIAENGRLRVGTYVLCLECVDSLSDEIVQQKVTAYFAKQGLFGGVPPTR